MSARTTYSLRRRLLVLLLAPLLLVAALALLDTYREASATANTVSDRVLAGSALAIAERVVVAEDGSLEVDIPYVALEMLTSSAQDRVFYRIDGPPGTFVTGYESLPSVGKRAGEDMSFFDDRFRGEPIRLAVLERSASSGLQAIPFRVIVAETTIARTQLTNALLLRSAIRLGIMLLAAAAIVWIAVSASLAPLYRMRAAISRRSPDDLSPIEEPVPREVGSLVDTMNTFMRRLDSALQSLKHFTGNASHQLRTPLSIIRTQLALAERAKTLDGALAATKVADASVADAERILAQLLLLARIDSDRGVGEPVDLSALARDITADRVPKARAAGVDLGFEGEDCVKARVDGLLVREMLGNLIDNAIEYAGTGAEATVRVYAADGAAILEVEDTGPGIPEPQRHGARHRFQRGAETKGGMGLGLAIVEEIATLFSGTLTLAEGPSGQGLKAQIRFPKVATTDPTTTP
ncbi:sensor histidine kinase [Paradevosia shaoguanensis]|uniref:histidine kinase n=1 Tax=Paradevosia shaoguanensis TaxID=1335043 RepID=A0AA41QLM9_9HYPH|nr:sensor histidine kinase [Paradevosia shaoguanensis]MCF1741970.1 sensor histidine kinase [Paradevosia shaoguanensis]MCI0126453.1 sensor histidine kinase [Paradevosia shaoguanensis]